MIDWSQFHFLRPGWFAALLPLAILLWLMRRHRTGGRWEAVCDAALLPFVLIGSRDRATRHLSLAVLIGGILAIAALAGPTWSRLPQPVFGTQSALVIALDLSRSMEAGDITPSRLVRARFKVADLVRQRQEGQTGLLVYAGDAFTVVPLTDDGATIVSQLPAVTTDIMPVPGNRTDHALTRAGELLRQAGHRRGDVLLITDEVDEPRAEPVARALGQNGYRVSVLGLGTEQGAPIPLPNGGFLKDRRGEIVIAALDEAPMRRLAQNGGGIYVRLAVDDSDLAALNRQFSTSAAADQSIATELKTDVWEEQGPWLLLALLPLAALAFRRGYVAVLLLAVLPLPRPANAMDWDSLWLRPDQQAKRALDAGDAGHAAQLFRDPDWKGAAHYRAGEYDAAAAALEGKTGADSLYNRGNALAQVGRLPEAIAAYEEALKRDPGNADAKFNKEEVEKELKRRAKPSPQPNGQQGESQDKSQNGDSQPQQGGSQMRPDDSGEIQAPVENGQTDISDSKGAGKRGDEEPQPATEESAESNETTDTQEQPDRDQQPKPGDAGHPGEEKETQDQSALASATADDEPLNEEDLAAEQWLRRIPDDPGGLLRRKFLYQYRQRQGEAAPGDKTW